MSYLSAAAQQAGGGSAGQHGDERARAVRNRVDGQARPVSAEFCVCDGHEKRPAQARGRDAEVANRAGTGGERHRVDSADELAP